jgi:hypothetical protein
VCPCNFSTTCRRAPPFFLLPTKGHPSFATLFLASVLAVTLSLPFPLCAKQNKSIFYHTKNSVFGVCLQKVNLMSGLCLGVCLREENFVNGDLSPPSARKLSCRCRSTGRHSHWSKRPIDLSTVAFSFESICPHLKKN